MYIPDLANASSTNSPKWLVGPYRLDLHDGVVPERMLESRRLPLHADVARHGCFGGFNSSILAAVSPRWIARILGRDRPKGRSPALPD